MKCEGFELIWNTLSLSKLKEITRSRFTWRVGTEKRSRIPLFLYNFQHDTPLRIDCISNMLNLHFLPTRKNIVHKSSICPPTWLPFLKLCIQSSLQVFPCMVNGLIQFTWQSGLFPHLPVLVWWTLQFQFGPLPFQLLAKLRCRISSRLTSHTHLDTSEWSFLSL